MTGTTTTLLTYDDWLAMPEVNTFQEIIEGALIVSPTPGWDHASVLQNLNVLFHQAASSARARVIRQTPLGVRLSLHNVPEPDLLFIRKDRLRKLVVGSRVIGPPDLVLEVVSPTSVKMDNGAKFRLYAEHGVPEYWIVNPMQRSIAVHALTGDQYDLLSPNAPGLYHSRVLPGLAVSLDACFSGPLSDDDA